jgi:hypothetical protein
MASSSTKPVDSAIRYQSLGNFYSADRRRRTSPERDVGLWWRVGAHGPVYRAAWVRETGELYVVRLGPVEDGKGEVVVLGRAESRGELEEILDGWQDVCHQPDSMTWLRHQALRMEPPERPSQSLARASASHLQSVAAARLARRRWREPRGLPLPDAVVERPERPRIAPRRSVSTLSRFAPPHGNT